MHNNIKSMKRNPFLFKMLFSHDKKDKLGSECERLRISTNLDTPNDEIIMPASNISVQTRPHAGHQQGKEGSA